MQDLISRLRQVKDAIHGCESLSVASTEGLVLATTHDQPRQGEFLAAVTSRMLNSCAKDLAPLKAGQCRALDFRGDRQVLVALLEDTKAYVICVLHPGAQAVNIDEPALRAVTCALPDVLHGQDGGAMPRYFLQRDPKCMFAIRRGYLVGRADHCDLVFASGRLDEEHLRFELSGDKLLARDLDTRNGSKLNRRPLTGTIEVGPGDRISLPGAGGFTIVAMDHNGTLLSGSGANAAGSGKHARAKLKKAAGKR